MIRPISLYLVWALFYAVSAAPKQESGSNSWTLMLFFLVPFIVIMIAARKRNAKYIISVVTVLLMLWWHVMLFQFSWVQFVRALLGDMILLDEIVLIFPAIFYFALFWYMTGPRNSRFAWMCTRVRFDLLLFMIPIGIFIGIFETVTYFGLAESRGCSDFIAIIILILCYPILIALILPAKDTIDMELHREVIDVGSRARVRISRVLVWNTHQRIMNALAVGVAHPARFIILSDKLIANLTPTELRAVVAHEVGHHRFSHIPFLVLTAIGALSWSTYPIQWLPETVSQMYLDILQVGFVIIAIVFVSRIFERQADAYAAVDFSKNKGSDVVTPEAIEGMSNALSSIASCHTIALTRNDPLHGSIAKRVHNLGSLIGCSIRAIPIDTTVKWLKITIISLLLVRFLVHLLVKFVL